MEPTTKELLDNFYATAEKNGMATGPVSDGRMFMFKVDYLRTLAMQSSDPAIKFGIRQADGTIKDVLLDRNKLLMEAEATTEKFIIVFVTDTPVKN